MRWFYAILFLFSLFYCRATGVELASLYFEEASAEPTGYTVEKMTQMKEFISSHNVQLIEINAFADNISSFEANKALAEKRLKYVLEYFGLEPEDGIVNVYGQAKQPVSFRPFNWERVDIYYSFDNEGAKQVDIADTDRVIGDHEIEYKENLRVPERSEIIENSPIRLNIEFESEQNQVKKGSLPKLEQLYKTMYKHNDLTIHIRGHVCCENKKGQSKKRAMAVYNYLKQKGISGKRMSVKGYGNMEPIAYPERTPDDMAKNRRIDVVFSSN
jgi:outer membrane protein OmpA-like peptidoglycan-associated protein